jgi:hypothetical protein
MPAPLLMHDLNFYFRATGVKFSRMKATRTRRTIALWLLAGVWIVAGSFYLDNRVDAALDVTKNPALSHFAWWCSKLGEGQIVGGVGVFIAAIFLVLRRTLQHCRTIFFLVNM